MSASNWLELDPVVANFGFERPTSTASPAVEERVGRILGVSLHDGVPEDVRSLFDAGRNVMVYGHLYYPFFAVGMQQVLVATEAAIRDRYISSGGSRKRASAAAMVEWLAAQLHISKALRVRLDRDRDLRNKLVHQRFQMIVAPGLAVTTLRGIAEDINELFPREMDADQTCEHGSPASNQGAG